MKIVGTLHQKLEGSKPSTFGRAFDEAQARGKELKADEVAFSYEIDQENATLHWYWTFKKK